jgi:GntR family transcriptional regulator
MREKAAREDLCAVVRVTLIGQTTARATRPEQQRLGVGGTDEVMRITQVRFNNERPVAFERIVLPLARLPPIARDGADATDIFTLAKEHGLTLGLARERLGIVRAGVQVAAHLRIGKGTSVLKLDRITLTTDGTPIEWRVSFVVPDR